MNIKIIILITLFQIFIKCDEEILPSLTIKKNKHYFVLEKNKDLEDIYNPVLYLSIVFVDENEIKFRSLKKIKSS